MAVRTSTRPNRRRLLRTVRALCRTEDCRPHCLGCNDILYSIDNGWDAFTDYCDIEIQYCDNCIGKKMHELETKQKSTPVTDAFDAFYEAATNLMRVELDHGDKGKMGRIFSLAELMKNIRITYAQSAADAGRGIDENEFGNGFRLGDVIRNRFNDHGDNQRNLQMVLQDAFSQAMPMLAQMKKSEELKNLAITKSYLKEDDADNKAVIDARMTELLQVDEKEEEEVEDDDPMPEIQRLEAEHARGGL